MSSQMGTVMCVTNFDLTPFTFLSRAKGMSSNSRRSKFYMHIMVLGFLIKSLLGYNRDILHLIFNDYELLESFTTPGTLLELRGLCCDLFHVVRPFLYEHIHLKNEKVERAFLDTVNSPGFPQHLLSRTRTFQVVLRPPSSPLEDLGNVIKRMTSLRAFNVCYVHGDLSFIERLAELNDKLPATLQTLHLRPVVEETFLSVSSRTPHQI